MCTIFAPACTDLNRAEILRCMNLTHAGLDARMDQRRLRLGLKWKQVAELAGITQQTLLELRKERVVSDVTVSRVERALQWAPGSIAAIRSGQEPTEVDPDPDPVGPEWWQGELVGPTDLLHEGERLRWRDRGNGRVYELEAEGVSFEAGMETKDLATALPQLRRTMALRVARLNALMVERSSQER